MAVLDEQAAHACRTRQLCRPASDDGRSSCDKQFALAHRSRIATLEWARPFAASRSWPIPTAPSSFTLTGLSSFPCPSCGAYPPIASLLTHIVPSGRHPVSGRRQAGRYPVVTGLTMRVHAVVTAVEQRPGEVNASQRLVLHPPRPILTRQPARYSRSPPRALPRSLQQHPPSFQQPTRAARIRPGCPATVACFPGACCSGTRSASLRRPSGCPLRLDSSSMARPPGPRRPPARRVAGQG